MPIKIYYVLFNQLLSFKKIIHLTGSYFSDVVDIFRSLLLITIDFQGAVALDI